MDAALQAAVEEAYLVFAPYAAGQRVDFAAEVSVSSETNAEMRAALARSPVRSLETPLMLKYLEYIDAAYGDGGYDQDEFRHFLPRILHMIACGGYAGRWGRECLERCLERAGTRASWSSREIEAVDRVLALAKLT